MKRFEMVRLMLQLHESASRDRRGLALPRVLECIIELRGFNSTVYRCMRFFLYVFSLSFLLILFLKHFTLSFTSLLQLDQLVTLCDVYKSWLISCVLSDTVL